MLLVELLVLVLNSLLSPLGRTTCLSFSTKLVHLVLGVFNVLEIPCVEVKESIRLPC